MPSRYVRDELIIKALDMAQVPNLNSHDIPGNVVQQDAYAIGWIQDIIDFWYHMVPFSSTVTNVSLNCVANSDQITLPSDFILDVRNGYLVETVPSTTTSMKRVIRVPLQKWLNRQVVFQNPANTVNHPYFYVVQGKTAAGLQLLKVTPTPTINTVGTLWYYQLPPILDANDKPTFPNDYCIVEYVRIRALEWCRAYDPGTSQKFCDKIVAGMKANGLMNEPEDDELPFDQLQYRKTIDYRTAYTYGWMGPR